MSSFGNSKQEICLQIRDLFQDFEKKFYPVHVCHCAEQDLGMVTREIYKKLLAHRAIFLDVEGRFDPNKQQFSVVIIKTRNISENTNANNYSYNEMSFRDALQSLESFSRGSLELEAKAFVLGLHALGELREKVNTLEKVIRGMAARLDDLDPPEEPLHKKVW